VREAGVLCALVLMLGGCGMEGHVASRSAPHAASSARPARADDARSRKLARPSAPASAARHEQARALKRLVGQKLMVSYRGTVDPPRELLDRITRGEVGSVILFKENVPADGAAGVRRNIRRLQDAARRGAIRRCSSPPTRRAARSGACPDLRTGPRGSSVRSPWKRFVRPVARPGDPCGGWESG
jgi:hypothetical protein